MQIRNRSLSFFWRGGGTGNEVCDPLGALRTATGTNRTAVGSEIFLVYRKDVGDFGSSTDKCTSFLNNTLYMEDWRSMCKCYHNGRSHQSINQSINQSVSQKSIQTASYVANY